MADNGNTQANGSVPIRLLLVDNHPLILMGLAALFEGEPDFEICGTLDSLDTALDFLARSSPDVIFCGLEIDDGDGLKLLSTVGETPLIVVTACEQPVVARRALELGAKGYILTREHSANILLAVRQVVRGEIYVCGGMVAKIIDRLIERPEDSQDTVESMLSKRELEVFELVGQGFNTRQIADTLHLSRKTIDTYRLHIRTKLGLAANSEIAPKAIAWLHGARN